MKRIAFLFLALIMLLSLFGCAAKDAGQTPAADTPASSDPAPAQDAQNTETNDKPYAGTTITVVTANSAPVRAASARLSEFEEATGIKVNIEIYEPSDAIEKVAINAAAQADGIDVFAYRPIQESLSYEANGWFAPLDDHIAAAGADYDYEDFFASARDATTGKDGHIYGIPYLVEGEILYVNTEMFASLGLEKSPETMDELLDACAAAYDPASNRYGIALRGEGNQAVTQFSGFLYSFGGDFIDYKTNTATMNTPEALAALEYYADLLQYGPDGITSANLSDSLNYFKQGLTLFRIDAYSQNPVTTDPEQSLVWDKVDYSLFPAGSSGAIPYNITAWSWAISASSKNQDAAWEFIRWASSKDVDLTAATDGAFSARTSTWASPEAAESTPAALAEVIQKTGEIGRTLDRPLCFDAAEVRALVGEMIDAANEGLRGDELAAFVETKNAEIQAILDK